MDSKEYIDQVKDEVSILPSNNAENWCVKTQDALKAIDMAKEEAKQEIEESTLYSIRKGDFVTIYNRNEERYVDGKIDRITPSAFYFTATNSKDDEKIYSREQWCIQVEI